MIETIVRTTKKPRPKKEHAAGDAPPKRQPPYNVILLNDDDHTYQYVITMLQQLFGYPPEKGYQMACEVDTTGRVVVLTTTREHAELKRDQIHAFGPDPFSSKECKGSMSAMIEPAMG
jgi:ATP-dependent Clp protease adaptor protein ClpS